MEDLWYFRTDPTGHSELSCPSRVSDQVIEGLRAGHPAEEAAAEADVAPEILEIAAVADRALAVAFSGRDPYTPKSKVMRQCAEVLRGVAFGMTLAAVAVPHLTPFAPGPTLPQRLPTRGCHLRGPASCSRPCAKATRSRPLRLAWESPPVPCTPPEMRPGLRQADGGSPGGESSDPSAQGEEKTTAAALSRMGRTVPADPPRPAGRGRRRCLRCRRADDRQ